MSHYEAPSGSPRPRRVVLFKSGIIPPDVEEFDRASHPDVTKLVALLEQLPAVKFLRVFPEASRVGIAALVARAKERDRAYRDPEFFSYWFADTADGGDPKRTDQVLASPQHRDIVRGLFLSRPGSPPTVNPNDLKYGVQFGIHEPPMGTGAKYAWDYLPGGGGGSGVGFADVEAVLPMPHEDLPNVPTFGVSGPVPAGLEDHATAVLGIVLAKDNKKGIVGVAPEISAKSLVTNFINGQVKTAVAVGDAAALLAAGDVLLIEYQLYIDGVTSNGAATKFGVPVECEWLVYQAIKTATTAGIVVVEPAGNGDFVSTPVNLDTLPVEGGSTLDPDSRGYLDSGAIVVSAAKWDMLTDPSAPVNRRLAWAPYGKRVDCYARGEGVATCRADGNNVSKLVAENFGGTSAASAIVAATALQIQGMKKTSGAPLTPAQMRSIFRDATLGTVPVAEALPRPIGLMPNLKNIVARLTATGLP